MWRMPSEDPGHVLIQKITRIRWQLAREQGQNDSARVQKIRSVIRGDRSGSTIVVLDSNDVVLTKIAPGLDLDQFERNFAGIFQPMRRADRNVDRFVLVHD